MPHPNHVESKSLNRFLNNPENTMNSTVSNSVGMVLLRLRDAYLPQASKQEVQQAIKNCLEELNNIRNQTDSSVVSHAIDYIRQLSDDPIHAQLDKLSLYLPDVEGYALKEHIFPLSEVIALVWMAINDHQQFTHNYQGTPEEQLAAAKNDYVHRQSTFFRCLCALKHDPVCHQGTRNDIVFLLNEVYQNVHIIEDERSVIYAVLRQQLVTLVNDNRSLIERSPELIEALFTWLEKDNAAEMMRLLDPDKRIIQNIKNIFTSQGSNPQTIDLDGLVQQALQNLSFSRAEEHLLDVISSIFRKNEITNHLKRNEALLKIKQQIKTAFPVKHAFADEIDNFNLIIELYDYYQKFSSLLATNNCLDTLRTLENGCQIYFEAIINDTNPSQYICLIHQYAGKVKNILVTCKTKSAHDEVITTFFDQWSSAQKTWDETTERKLYQLLLNDDFKKSVMLSDDEISTLQPYAHNLFPLAINRIFLQALLTKPCDWSEPFTQIFNQVLFKETSLPNSSYSKSLWRQLCYLQQCQQENYPARKPIKMILLPHQVTNHLELARIIDLLSVEQFQRYYRILAVTYNPLLWKFIAAGKGFCLERLIQLLKLIPSQQWSSFLNSDLKKKTAYIHDNVANIIKEFPETQRYTLIQAIGVAHIKPHCHTAYHISSILSQLLDQERIIFIQELGFEWLKEIIVNCPNGYFYYQSGYQIGAILRHLPEDHWPSLLDYLKKFHLPHYNEEHVLTELSDNQKKIFQDLHFLKYEAPSCSQVPYTPISSVNVDSFLTSLSGLFDKQLPREQQQILTGIEEFGQYLQSSYPKNKDKNDLFVIKAKSTCNDYFSVKETAKLSMEEKKKGACQRIYDLAGEYFPRNILLILIDLVFVPIGVLFFGIPLLAKHHFTGAYTFFGAPTNEQKKLGEYIGYSCSP